MEKESKELLEKTKLENEHLRLLCKKLRDRYQEIKKERDEWKNRFEKLKSGESKELLEKSFRNIEQERLERKKKAALEMERIRRDRYLAEHQRRKEHDRKMYKKRPDKFEELDDLGNPVKPKSFMEELQDL